jgi:hypothetical protein
VSARKWRQKIMLGMAMTRAEAGVVQGDGNTVRQLLWVGPGRRLRAEDLDHADHGAEQSPISGLIEAMVPSVVR